MADEGSFAFKTVKLPRWDGKQGTFQTWYARFKAYAGVFGFSKALEVDTDMPINEGVTLDLSEEVGRLSEAARKRNAVAMANLTMAFESEVAMTCVYEAMTEDWPSGLAHKVTSRLIKKYAPKDRMSRVEMRVALNNIAMRDDEDPCSIFEQIAEIKNRFQDASHKVDEDEFVAIVMEKAPERYKTVLTTEQLRLGEAVDLESMSVAMNRLWRSSVHKYNLNAKHNESTEIALSSFTGSCFHCKKKGHKIHQCPDKRNGNERGRTRENRFQGRCNNCGKNGHKKVNWWKLADNREKAPKWYKDKKGQGSASIGDDD